MGFELKFRQYRDKLKTYLSKLFPNINFCVETKADSKFKIVSAASILSKTERDRKIDNLNNKLKDLNLGPGYPSDPITKIFFILLNFY